jgi:hypothetical protein
LATADRETTDREPESPRTPESPALPNARLNPLLNPLLAKQLGRWAHIYYTASVDKREAAIEKLVSELEAEESRLNGGVRPEPPRETLPTSLEPIVAGQILVDPTPEANLTAGPRALRNVPEPFLSPESFSSNAVTGAPASKQPKFEAPATEPPISLRQHEDVPFLHSREVESQRASEVALHGITPQDLPQKRRSIPAMNSTFVPEPLDRDAVPAELEHSPAEVPENIPESWQELLGSTAAVPPTDRGPAPYAGESSLTSETHPDATPYVSRDAVAYSHAFDDILAQSEKIQNYQPPARNRRLPLIVATILGVVAGSFWLVQSGRLRPGTSDRAHKPTAPVAQPTTPPTAETTPDTNGSGTPATPSTMTAPASTSAPSPQAPQAATATHVAGSPATSQAPTLANSSRALGSSTGTRSAAAPQAPASQSASAAEAIPLPPDPDFEAGMRELQGPQRDSADAARHFWQSVKNQNSSALIPLAQLYATGDGVTKDCDQAKVLLDAATRQAKSRTQFLKAEMSRASLRTADCE